LEVEDDVASFFHVSHKISPGKFTPPNFTLICLYISYEMTH